MTIFVTGGAGFIGSQFIRDCVRQHPQSRIINFDKLTYAGNLANLETVERTPGYSFVRGDICDREALLAAIPQGADAIVHFAAESHVDRSITGAAEFVRTNVLGTQILLDAAWERRVKRFLHISTDEVGGSMEPTEWLDESSPLDPRSPYAASKTAAEHLVRAAGATFGLDFVITRTSNNYGPYQFPEKLLPLAICNALNGDPIPVYGDGQQIRDWVHVADNCRALLSVLHHGRAGETYHIGGGSPQTNLQVLRTLLRLLGKPASLLRTVKDRPGHDRRYAVNFAKIERELGWSPRISFDEGLLSTIEWYRQNQAWIESVRSGEYLRFYHAQYGSNVGSLAVAGCTGH
jgi:dTDP-glucose 4,6-dehydratase